MKNMGATVDMRSVASRRVALAAAAAAALTASLALSGHWTHSPFAAARPGAVMLATGASPDGPVPCPAPDFCNIG